MISFATELVPNSSLQPVLHSAYLEGDGLLVLHGLEELLLLVREPVVLVGGRPPEEAGVGHADGGGGGEEMNTSGSEPPAGRRPVVELGGVSHLSLLLNFYLRTISRRLFYNYFVHIFLSILQQQHFSQPALATPLEK